MARIKRAVNAVKKRRKVFKLKKREYRKLWIARINAGARICGTTYSRMIDGLKKAGVDVNRKVLADLAVNDMAAFKKLADIAVEARA